MQYEFPDFGRNPRRTLWSQYITVPEGRNGKFILHGEIISRVIYMPSFFPLSYSYIHFTTCH